MKKQLFVTGLFLVSNVFFAQTSRLWKEASPKNNSEIFENKTSILSPKIYTLDFENLKNALVKAPKKFAAGKRSDIIISFPNSNGIIEDFKVRENSNFDPELAAKYPDIKSYVGVGLEDASSTVYFSISPLGLSSMEIYGDKSAVFIEPYTKDLSTYVVYKKSDKKANLDKFECTVLDVAQKGVDNSSLTARPNADDGKLRTFRLALSCTGEYTAFFGGTVAGALAAMNNTMTRVNGVFEKDFSARMVIIANNNTIIYTNAATDPYSNATAGVAGAWNGELQNNLTAVIGEANYDIGHLFGATGGGGNAGCIGCVCTNGTKGRGFTSPADAPPLGTGPVGDTFDIDYVAHEMGHQFGGNHTFSHSIEAGGVNNMEPGSGSTIMGYAGITNQNVVMHSTPFFHAISIQQITNNIKTKTCPVTTNTGNAIPTADAGLDYIIPKGTPFMLTGTSTDSDGDTLTYIWEQMDPASAGQTGANSAATATKASGPTFRSYTPQTVPVRYFPSLDRTLLGATTTSSPPNTSSPIIVEALSNVARTYNFRFTSRDNKAGGSGNNSDDMVVTVNAGAGPFTLTSQNTAGVVWTEGQSYTITWNVANTTAAPVSTPNVTILLSKDGGLTWPTVLVASAPNNGTYNYTVPGGLGNTVNNARIMVKGLNNIFFNVNLQNFTINSSAVVIPPNPGTPGTPGTPGAAPSPIYDGLMIYPVPSSDGIVYIKLDFPRLVPQAPYPFSYTIYAMDGKLVIPKRNRLFFTEHLEKIDLRGVPSGTYMIEVDLAGEKIVKKLLMLNK
ncbi:Ser-Thr-rich glycosyl-phosphatidyl-inositol-anchored membrane family protein [Chryseobacterium sp. MOF25P]|uniref:reprolysin-like metallopeptidase n=1 Tax=unclassified Chryseobacterium TaxID=2593645 RepID=UPI00080537C6|nr:MULTISPECIES: zinc-dependent metalloprotease family protein [unclassified Chryseobacterium]OBW41173.1 Ser-Thr-rich glycosyl-phosphatidyl-inositol-anchored membrane family protein [Chryseobacterium sp. MOF25P]OBW45202.1 Ser-Thr-rich glycosyl-phosphatidyl-inositol-anchored membrane family protein [Chryseobacterium sp. BGARF1]